MNKTWSEQLEQRFHLRLPPDLVAWLDQEIWRDAGGAEFQDPRTPEQLLQPEPGVIWPGFMLPDTLPIIGNDYGDWLCLRIARDGSIDEVICWCHAGGDWIPYGRTLPEALVYDAAFGVLYARRPELAEPSSHADVARAVRWAERWIDTIDHFQPFWEPGACDPLDELGRAGICEVPVRRDLILRHLESPLKTQSNPSVADALGTTWEPDFVSWIFDTALIPELRMGDLRNHFQVAGSELTQQDWDGAEQEALKVTSLRQDLGWAFDISGWAAERRGDVQTAIRHYLQGVKASSFADDSIRFRTHWFTEGYGKFAAARLAELRDELSAEVKQDPYLRLFWENDPESLRSRVRDYWLQEAEAAEGRQDYPTAYRCFYNAGWDCGLHFVKSLETILGGLERTAGKAGFPALAAIAQLHTESL